MINVSSFQATKAAWLLLVDLLRGKDARSDSVILSAETKLSRRRDTPTAEQPPSRDRGLIDDRDRSYSWWWVFGGLSCTEPICSILVDGTSIDLVFIEAFTSSQAQASYRR
jgi:hypothetical protein